MKNKQTPGAFGNKHGKKLTLKTQIGFLLFNDKKLKQAVATPEHPDGYAHTTPFEMEEYLKDLKANTGAPKTINKALTFNYTKVDSSEVGNYLWTVYNYEDKNYQARFIELKAISDEKIDQRKKGLELNEKYFTTYASMMKPGALFIWKDYGYAYEINDKQQFVSPHIEAYNTMRGLTPTTFHNKIILK